MKTKNQRLAMEIVNQLIEIGSPIWAVGPEHFVVTDTDLPEELDAQIGDVIRAFGPIDRIRREIVEYLTEIGRVVDANGSSPTLHVLH
jgi:hypothetical protein